MVINNTPLSTCAISVIIPMYNAEKYLGECLDSILAQTFQDFEVILVNDCSTDNSRQIAESYIEKFGSRLKIYDNEKNSGAGATRNNGLRYASGEYVFFMDSDDMILPNGLEEAYKVAKYFDVDVVNITRSYKMSEDGKNLTLVNLKATTPRNESLLESNLEWRVQGLLADKFSWAPWRRFLRRDFLINNEIFFPENLKRCEDEVWTHGLLFCAKKIIHIPLAFYFYRIAEGSITYSKRTPMQNINSRIHNIFHDLQWIDNIMSKVPFFEENPQYRYAILEHSTQRFFIKFFKISIDFSATEIYKSIKQEFGKSFGEYALIVSVLCALVNKYQKIILNEDKKITKTKSYKSIEIELRQTIANRLQSLKIC